MKLLDLSPVSIGSSGEPSVPGLSTNLGSGWISGVEALNRCRLDPQSTLFDVWKDLSLDPLASGSGMRHRADLAVAQLKALNLDASPSWCAAVPAHWTKEHLQVFLGVTKECGIQISSLFPRALAVAKTLQIENRPVTIVEWDWSEARLVEVDQLDGAWTVTGLTRIPEAGVLNSFRRESRLASAWMLKEHRVDPLHSGRGEQRVFDGWWAWHSGAATDWMIDQGPARLNVSDRSRELKQAHQEWINARGLQDMSTVVMPRMLAHLTGQSSVLQEPDALEGLQPDPALTEQSGARWMEKLPVGTVASSPVPPVTHLVIDGIAEPVPAGLHPALAVPLQLEDGRTAIPIHVPDR